MSEFDSGQSPGDISDGFDPGRRRLCPDGTCVGVIGPEGRCRICGTEDTEAPRGLGADAFAGGCATDEDESELAATEGERDPAPEDGAGFQASRGLCPDGTCVGVIGEDGRCKVCGTTAAA